MLDNTIYNNNEDLKNVLIELKQILEEDVEIYLNYYSDQNKNEKNYADYLKHANLSALEYLKEYYPKCTLGEICKFIAEDFVEPY
jgi:hypothetical protein